MRIQFNENSIEGRVPMENRIGFGARLGAVLIDVVIIGVLNFVIGGTVATMLGIGMMSTAGAVDSPEAAAGMISGMIAGMLAMMAISAILGVLYFLIEGVTGASPGKMILGIKVGTIDGKQGNIALYLKRWAIKNLPSLLLVLSTVLGLAGLTGLVGIIGIISQIIALVLLIGAFWIFGASKQCLWDKLAATAIFKRSDLTAA